MSAAILAVPSTAWASDSVAEDENEWSLKLFGRFQYDAGDLNLPEGADDDEGMETEIRRVRLGVKGDMPSGFGYKIEADFVNRDVTFTDTIITYETGNLTLTAGNHNTFQGLEELSSSNNTSFIERSAWTDAFGFERRVGLSAQLVEGDVQGQLGFFTDNLHALADGEDDGWSIDGRFVYAPRVGDTQLHFGASAHWNDHGEDGALIRYKQRPHLHVMSQRFIDTGKFLAKGELWLGLETAALSGPLHVSAEAFWQTATRTGVEDAGFFGGSVEAGVFLTGGDHRRYKHFRFDSVKPTKPVGSGGIGAVQLNVRYDFLDMEDVSAGILGGQQNGYTASLIWTPIKHIRLMVDLGHMDYDRSPVMLGTETSYGVDTLGLRGQLTF